MTDGDLPPNTAPFFPNIFYQNQFRAQPVYPPKDTDLRGRTAIITGANSGIGLECCRQLLSYKLSTLILAVRSPTKGDAAAAQLRQKYPGAEISVWELDMSSYLSIQAFVQRVDTHLPRVDFVVLNAGVMKAFAIVPSTGHEEMFQVNYLSQALLTLLLLPVLKAKKPPTGLPARLTWVNGALSLFAKFPNRHSVPLLPSFDNEEIFADGEWYNTSKLLAHFFAWKIAEFVSADDVIVSVTDPGYVRGTELASEKKEEMMNMRGAFVLKRFMSLFEKMARTLEDGTSTIVDTVVNKGKEAHGCYVMGWRIAPFATMLYGPEGEEIRERLWQETVDEFKFANVEEILSIMKASKDSKAA
ncbi:NAD(P)-binding protein [Cryphonectria parasitica EP155]|uniref:NAD(P)-binding protein n=1 Tax=Cryphonectria parasitica (strain ATCC 38755 / EP155) TaxID=660469 RepID=A0A9P4Y3U9_CRYP1|nr:NAD(P)-binding protein [Cryphonectria parasitica EP155]KAF3766447.1 NAD(P)-binding protein [Cryphonectria parasitica EP155]